MLRRCCVVRRVVAISTRPRHDYVWARLGQEPRHALAFNDPPTPWLVGLRTDASARWTMQSVTHAWLRAVT